MLSNTPPPMQHPQQQHHTQHNSLSFANYQPVMKQVQPEFTDAPAPRGFNPPGAPQFSPQNQNFNYPPQMAPFHNHGFNQNSHVAYPNTQFASNGMHTAGA